MDILLINDDCFNVMLKLIREGKKFDLIFLDPPYFDWGGKAGYREDWKLPNDIPLPDHGKLSFIASKLTDKVLLFGNQPQLAKCYSEWEKSFRLSFSIIVLKHNWKSAHPVTPAEDRIIMRQHEEIWVLYSNDKKFSDVFDNFKIKTVLDGKVGKNEYTGHPAQKSLNLTIELIKTFTKEGDWVLDPFMGSGTTPLACKILNRNCIGIEIKKEYYDIAEKRVNSWSSLQYTLLNSD